MRGGRLHIGFVVPRCVGTNSHGRYVLELSRQLATSQDVTVYSGARAPSMASAVTFRYLPMLDWPMAARVATGWAASVPIALLAKADILHTQGADSPIGNVVTAHCCTAAMRLAQKPSAARQRFNHALGARAEQYSMKKPSTRAVIAVSDKVKREIESHYRVDPHLITVIQPGVDLTAFHPDHKDTRHELRQRAGLEADDFVVLHAGGNYRLKGLLPLLAAVRRVGGSVKVVAVGGVADRWLENEAAADIEAGRLILAGRTDRMHDYYALADCFALPTLYETFSLVTLEAMASGLPVIVSKAAGISEVLTHGVDAMLLDDPNDTGTLAGFVDAMAHGDLLRRQLADAARRTAERYSWQQVAERTLAVYRSVAA